MYAPGTAPVDHPILLLHFPFLVGNIVRVLFGVILVKWRFSTMKARARQKHLVD